MSEVDIADADQSASVWPVLFIQADLLQYLEDRLLSVYVGGEGGVGGGRRCKYGYILLSHLGNIFMRIETSTTIFGLSKYSLSD